jgi:hypothetical protein
MLHRVGSRSDFAIRWEHGASGWIRDSGAKLNSGQHDCSSRHRNAAGRYNTNNPGFHIAERDRSKHDDSRFDIAEWHPWDNDTRFNDTQHNHARLDTEHNRSWFDVARRNAGCYDPRFDISERHAEYYNTGIYFAEPSAGYDHGTRFYLAQRYAEYNHPWNNHTRNNNTWNNGSWHNTAANHTSGQRAALNRSTSQLCVFGDGGKQYALIHLRVSEELVRAKIRPAFF